MLASDLLLLATSQLFATFSILLANAQLLLILAIAKSLNIHKTHFLYFIYFLNYICCSLAVCAGVTGLWLTEISSVSGFVWDMSDPGLCAQQQVDTLHDSFTCPDLDFYKQGERHVSEQSVRPRPAAPAVYWHSCKFKLIWGLSDRRLCSFNIYPVWTLDYELQSEKIHK